MGISRYFNRRDEILNISRTMDDSRRKIERIIETDPIIKKGLQRGIVNTRALARYLQQTREVNSSTDAILGVLRRLPIVRQSGSAVEHQLRDSKLALKNNVGELTLELEPEVMKRVLEFANTLKSSRGDKPWIQVGARSIEVIADEKSITELKNTIRDSSIIKFSTDLAEISVTLSHEAEHGVGAIGRITTEVALNDICIQGTAYIPPEFVLLVNEKNATRAYDALNRVFAEETSL